MLIICVKWIQMLLGLVFLHSMKGIASYIYIFQIYKNGLAYFFLLIALVLYRIYTRTENRPFINVIITLWEVYLIWTQFPHLTHTRGLVYEGCCTQKRASMGVKCGKLLSQQTFVFQRGTNVDFYSFFQS